MKLQEIHITEFVDKTEIVSFDNISDEYFDAISSIFNKSGVRPDRNKEPLLVAITRNEHEDHTIHGAVFSSLERDEDQNAYVFDFDVAVEPSSRGQAMIGLQLIDAALEEFENLKAELDRVYVRTWVINPKLAHWLEYRRGFEPESTHSDGSAHMTYYGINEDVDLSPEIKRILFGVVKQNWFFAKGKPPEEQAEIIIHKIYAYGGDATAKLIHYFERDDLVNAVQMTIDQLNGINEDASEYAGLEDADEFEEADEVICEGCGNLYNIYNIFDWCSSCDSAWCDRCVREYAAKSQQGNRRRFYGYRAIQALDRMHEKFIVRSESGIEYSIGEYLANADNIDYEHMGGCPRCQRENIDEIQ